MSTSADKITVVLIKHEASCAMHEPPCPTCVAVAVRNERARIIKAIANIRHRTNREWDILVDVERAVLKQGSERT